MKLPWYIFLALRQLAPSGRRLGSVFFVLSVVGVALGVAVLVIVQSVMGGFGQVHRERIVDTSGHIDVSEGGYPFAGGYQLAADILNRPEVERVTPYARGFVMARRGNLPVFPAVYGFAYTDDPVFAIQQYMVAGTLDDLYDDTVLISQGLARQLGAWIGSEIEVFSPVMIERFESEEVVLPMAFTVAGVFSIDWNQEFLPGMLCTLRAMQELYGLEDLIHGIAVRLKEGTNEFQTAIDLQAELTSRKNVLTWKEKWADFLWVLDLEKTMMLFLNLFIVAVAVFAIAIAQLLTVVRKTREIGLLAVIGGNRSGVLAIYCFQGCFIGLIGAVLGIGFALTSLSFRDPIIDLLANLSGTRETLIRYYYFANLPVAYDIPEIIRIGLLATGLATLASLIPAWRAARLKPVDTLRIEQ